MGSHSSKFGPESLVNSSQTKHPINFVHSNASNMTSSSGAGMSSGKFYRANKSEQSTKDMSLVNTSFKWNFGGHAVLLTGNFTNWKDHIPLQKIGNEFNVILRLPRGVYQYKYIVDGDWRFSPDDPTTADELGNINNIVDTTNVETMNRIINKPSQNHMKKNDAQGNHEAPSVNQNMNIINPQMNFSDQAPIIPPHLLNVVFLNEREKMEEHHYNNHQNSNTKADSGMEVEDSNHKISECSKIETVYRMFENANTLNPPTHVVLNHLGNLKQLNHKDRTYEVNTMTQRFKSKYATIKFYTSKFVSA